MTSLVENVRCHTRITCVRLLWQLLLWDLADVWNVSTWIMFRVEMYILELYSLYGFRSPPITGAVVKSQSTVFFYKSPPFIKTHVSLIGFLSFFYIYIYIYIILVYDAAITSSPTLLLGKTHFASKPILFIFFFFWTLVDPLFFNTKVNSYTVITSKSPSLFHVAEFHPNVRLPISFISIVI